MLQKIRWAYDTTIKIHPIKRRNDWFNTHFFLAKKWVNPIEKRRKIERNMPRYSGLKARLLMYSDWNAAYTAASTARKEKINIAGIKTSFSCTIL